MPSKWKFKLSPEEVLTKVEAGVKNCVGISMQDGLSKERKDVLQYYEQTAPKRQHQGNSSYVSSDVYDGVEMMKAQLLETFANGNDIVRFNPRNEQDIHDADIATKYVEHVIFEQNEGFNIFHDAIDDGLKARNGVVRVEWEEEYASDTVKFDKRTQDEVLGLTAQPDVTDVDANLDEGYAIRGNGMATYSGSYTIKIDKCHVDIAPVPPEEYFQSSRVKRREDGIRGYRTLKSRADLIADGYPRKKVDSINWDNDQSVEMSAEAQEREAVTSNGSTMGMNPVQDEMQMVLVYTAYLKLSLMDDGKAKLYRVIYAGNILFECDEVDEDCFVDWAPLRRAHSWWGNNFAKRIIPTQNARTVLTRAVLDHSSITTNPRWQVVQGGLPQPKEMLDNRLGGIVNVTRPDAITPLAYPNLNPFVFEVLSMLKDNKEENTGLSSLSQGLNKDAISSQNSQGLVENLVSLSQIRQKIIARNFALNFLAKLYLKVYRLVLQNEKKQKVIEIAGDYFTADPQQWMDQRTVVLSMHLGYGEADREAAKYVELWKLLTQDPAASRFVTPDKQHKLLVDGMRKNRVFNYQDYVNTPDKWVKPEPDPIETAKVKAQQTQADASMINAQAASKKAEVAEHHEQLRTQNDTLKVSATVQKNARDAERQDLDTANSINVSQREIALAEKVPPENQRGIFSANS